MSKVFSSILGIVVGVLGCLFLILPYISKNQNIKSSVVEPTSIEEILSIHNFEVHKGNKYIILKTTN